MKKIIKKAIKKAIKKGKISKALVLTQVAINLNLKVDNG